MTIILSTDFKTCIHIPFIQRYEDVKNISILSYQWYDTKGKGKDYRETILCFDGKHVFFYDHNDTIETEVYRILTGDLVSDKIDLSAYDCSPARLKPPKHYKRVEKIA